MDEEITQSNQQTLSLSKIDYDKVGESKIAPSDIEKKRDWLLSNNCSEAILAPNLDSSFNETEVPQDSSVKQNFTNPALRNADTLSTNETHAVSDSGSHFSDKESGAPIQSAISEKMMEENIVPVEHSIPALIKRYYLRNQIDLIAWNANPVLKRLLPILLVDQKVTSGIVMICQKRATEQLKKLHLIAMKTLPKDQDLIQELDFEKKRRDSKKKQNGSKQKQEDFTNDDRDFFVNNHKLFKTVFNKSFFNSLRKKLYEVTVRGIKVNLLDKFAVADPAQLEKAFKSAIDADGKRIRTFKKPFTVMENLWSLVLYCNEFLFELRKRDTPSNEEKRITIEEIKQHFLEQLREQDLYLEEGLYPVKRSKRSKRSKRAKKDLYFQAFLHVV